MARKRMFFSPAKAVRELGLPQTDVREALRDAIDVVRRARLRPRAPGDRVIGRLARPPDAQEPLELLLRLSHAAPAAPGRALRRLRLLPDRGRHRRPRRRARRRSRGQRARARPLAARRRALLRAGRPAPEHPIAPRLREAVRAFAIPRAALRGDHRRRRDGPRPRPVRDRRGPLSVLLPRGLGGRSLLHRDLRLHRPARARVRGQARHRAAAHEHHPRRRRRRPGRARSTCRRRTCESSA